MLKRAVLLIVAVALVAPTPSDAVQPRNPDPSTTTTAPAPLPSSLVCTIDEVGTSRKAAGRAVGEPHTYAACLDADGVQILRWWDPPTSCTLGARIVMRDWSYQCRPAGARR